MFYNEKKPLVGAFVMMGSGSSLFPPAVFCNARLGDVRRGGTGLGSESS